MTRAFIMFFSRLIIFILKPIKLYAYQSAPPVLKRIILAITTFFDWFMVIIAGQNETMMMNYKRYQGNFIFGHGIMVVSHQSAAENLVKPLEKNNNFMCIPFIANERDVFATYSPSLQQSPPLRAVTRDYMDTHIFTPEVRDCPFSSVQTTCDMILNEWAAEPEMVNSLKIRSVVTRIFIQLLANVTLTAPESEAITGQYLRRFMEFSLFAAYLPFMLTLLGSRQHIRTDVYNKLKAHDIDTAITEMTMFAAMFSVGTITVEGIKNAKKYSIDYRTLDHQEKCNYVTESLRLAPTVTAVHRVLEADETVMVANQAIQLTAAEEIAYPFVCTHHDTTVFTNPETFDIHRSQEEYDSVLSWSTGPHYCPAKHLSIVVTVMLLDKLSEHHDLATLNI